MCSFVSSLYYKSFLTQNIIIFSKKTDTSRQNYGHNIKYYHKILSEPRAAGRKVKIKSVKTRGTGKQKCFAFKFS